MSRSRRNGLSTLKLLNMVDNMLIDHSMEARVPTSRREALLKYITNKNANCGSNDFQDYFDDAKDSSQESRVKQVSRIKESFNQESRLK